MLKTTKKESLSMNDYLLKIQRIVDLVALVDNKLSAKDHIFTIFAGLSSEYEHVLLSIETRLELFTIEEIKSICFLKSLE